MATEYISKWHGKILHIYDHIYKQNYYYFNCKTFKDYQRLLKIKFKIDKPNKDDTDGNFNVYRQSGVDVYFLWTKGRRPEIVAHEVFHAVSYGLRMKGLPLTDDTEEAYAYLMQFLIKEILK